MRYATIVSFGMGIVSFGLIFSSSSYKGVSDAIVPYLDGDERVHFVSACLSPQAYKTHICHFNLLPYPAHHFLNAPLPHDTSPSPSQHFHRFPIPLSHPTFTSHFPILLPHPISRGDSIFLIPLPHSTTSLTQLEPSFCTRH